jgi:hypothetical protein
LLTRAATSPHFDDTEVASALLNTVRGALQNRSAEEKMAHLVRAFDALGHKYGIDGAIPLNTLLTKSQVKQMREVVDAAVTSLNNLAEEIEREPRPDSTDDRNPGGREVLQRIAARINNQTQIRRGFGESVVELLSVFALPDADIATRHYATTPGAVAKSWQEVLTKYRSVVAHGSSFDFGPGGTHDIWDVWRVIKHLHDILVRLLLTILGYDGTYQPTIQSVITHKTPDWVKSTTTATELGYI